MKTRILLSFLTILLFANSDIFSQVSINTDGAAPNSKAILDIKNTEKGILIPRMTTTQRTGITGLDANHEGLTVYDNETDCYWLWDGSAWQQFSTGGGSYNGWTDGGTNVYLTTNSDKVGIGTSNPQKALHIYNSLPYIRLEDSDGGNFWEIGNSGGEFRIYEDGGKCFTIATGGNVGIGTNSATVDLEIRTGATSTVYISGEAADNDAKLRLSENVSGTYYGYEFFYNGGENRLELWSKEFINGNDANRMTWESNGTIGIGTNNPQKILHIRNETPYIRFEDSDDNSYWEIGNTSGEFRIYSGENEKFEIQAGGNVGIGITDPAYKLQIDGTTAPASSGQDLGTSSLRWDLYSEKADVNEMTINTLLTAPKLATAPSTPVQGQVYFDTTSNKLRCYDGTAWNDLW